MTIALHTTNDPIFSEVKSLMQSTLNLELGPYTMERLLNKIKHTNFDMFAWGSSSSISLLHPNLDYPFFECLKCFKISVLFPELIIHYILRVHVGIPLWNQLIGYLFKNTHKSLSI